MKRKRQPASLATRLVFNISQAAELLNTSRDVIAHALDEAAQSGGRRGLRFFRKPGCVERSISRKALDDYIAALEREACGSY